MLSDEPESSTVWATLRERETKNKLGKTPDERKKKRTEKKTTMQQPTESEIEQMIDDFPDEVSEDYFLKFFTGNLRAFRHAAVDRMRAVTQTRA